MQKIMIEGIVVLIFCAIIEIFAGGLLETVKEELTRTIPALIIMIPPLMDLRGNIGGALASRIGTALHTGVIDAKSYLSAEMKANVISAIVLSFLASMSIGIISSLFGATLGREINVFVLLFIATGSGIISGVVLSFLTVLVAILSFRRGWDPDNVVAPLMATVGDYVTILTMVITMLMVVG